VIGPEIVGTGGTDDALARAKPTSALNTSTTTTANLGRI
jgi:hypothetical protein